MQCGRLPEGERKQRRLPCDVHGTYSRCYVKVLNLTPDFLMQPDRARSSTETLKQVEEQVHAACLGVAQTVDNMQTATGVKDAFTQHWIDDLIERSRNLRKVHPERSATDIQKELMAWVLENKDTIYNPFLTLKGDDANVS